MKPLVIYHADCLDGFGAAFAAWLKLGDEAEYLPCSYGEEFTYITEIAATNCEVYILDFSFPRDVMDLIFKHSKRVVWLDHHKSAFETMYPGHAYLVHGVIDQHSPNKYVELNNWKSGALISWEYFHPGTEVPRFVRHIDDYDRWCFQIDGTKAFNKAIWSYAPWSFTQWRDWFYDVKEGFNHTYWADFYTEGEAILRAHDQNVQSVVKGSARACEIEVNVKGEKVRNALEFFSIDPDPKLPGLAANCPHHLTSDVGHELANQSGTFGLCWHVGNDQVEQDICKVVKTKLDLWDAAVKFGKPLTAKCSLRSNGEYDVSAIAKVFGGGGHRNAAGFEVPIETLLGWMK